MPPLVDDIDLSQLPDQTDVVAPSLAVSEIDLSALPDQAGSSTVDAVTDRPIPTLSQAPEAPFMQPFWDLFKDTTAERKAKAANTWAMAEHLDIPPSVAYDNYDALTAQLGMRSVPTTQELLSGLFIPPIAMGFATAPAATLVGLAGYQALSEIESAAVSLVTGERYQVFRNQGLADLLPGEVSTLTKDVVDIFDIIGKGVVVGAGFKYAPKMAERITKNVIETYNLPKTIYVSATDLKAEMQTGGVMEKDVMDLVKAAGMTSLQWRSAVTEGLTIKIPSEKITTWQDKPWYASVKKLFKIDPFQQTTVTRAGEVTTGRPIAGLLTQEAATGQPVAAQVVLADRAAEEAMTALQAKPEVTDAQIGEVFDQATGTKEIPAAGAEDVHLAAPIPPEQAPPAKELSPDSQAHLIEEAVKFVAEKSPDLMPGMIDRAVAAGFDEASVRAYANEVEILDLQGLADRSIQPGEKMAPKTMIRRATGQVKDIARPISELAQLKQSYILSARAAREAFRAGNKEGVAKENARMKEIIARAKETEQGRAAVADRLKASRKIQDRATGKIALDYQEKINALFAGIDLTKPTEGTIERLQGLSDFVAREGVPLGISQAELNALDRLAKTPFRDLSGTFQQEILNTAQKLYDLGALKRALQLHKAGRELAQELDALVASTHNLEPTLSGEKKPTQTDNLKVGLLKTDNATLHTFRVADKIDGNADYAGENTRLIKEELGAEVIAKTNAQARINGVIEHIRTLGLETMPPEMARRVNVVLMAEQGARGQVETLLAQYEMTEIPTLTETERGVLTALRDAAGAKTAEIASVYERRENLPFPTVDNYFPIAYEKDAFVSPLEAIDPNRYRTKQVAQGFTKTRKPGVEDAPREDVLQVLEDAIINQEWYLHIQPVLDRHAALIRTPEFKEAAGEIMWNWWKDQVDIVARKGWTANAVRMPALRDIRRNLNVGVLGFKLSTVVMQPFAVFDAMAYAGSHWGPRAAGDILFEAVNAWTHLRSTMAFVKETPELALRHAGEIAVEETMQSVEGVAGWKASAVKASMAGLRFADIVTAAGSEKGLMKILRKQGLSEAAVKHEAAFLMELVSGSSATTLRPHILATGELAKTVFTFQTFFLNRWGLLSHDLIRTGATGTWKRKTLALTAIALMVAAGMAEDEARTMVYEMTTGKPSKQAEEGFLKAAALYIPRQLPLLGNLFKQGSVEPPVLREAKKAAQGAVQVADGKPIAGFEKMSEAVLTTLVGMPGTAQMFDLLDHVLADIKKDEAAHVKEAATR